jgi:hypothetical protein
MNERRKYPRAHIDYVTVEVYKTSRPNTTEIIEICTVVDLSENGMCFLSDSTFSSKQRLFLTFVLPESMVIIRTDAIVVHSDPSMEQKFSVGVQFIDPGLTELQLMKHFINKWMLSHKQQHPD